MKTTTATTRPTLLQAINTVTAWFRAHAGLSVIELAREADVRLLVLASLTVDGRPAFLHVGPLDRHVFDGVETVGASLEGCEPSDARVRRAFLEGLAAVLVERETGERIGAQGVAHRIVAESAPLPRAPRRSEARWWREQTALARSRYVATQATRSDSVASVA